MPIIEVKHLTKEYELGAVTSIKDTMRHTLAKIQGKGTWAREKFKALDDVNFSIEEGEVVGIIGHNGAGKSTLLKHLANITNPTSGEVIVNGSIAPLIEVGAGVNPELTGRENIFLNGAILGIPKKVIQSKVDEIIEFSELEQFIDTPVKRYSSGMTVKLGFSIATSMEADILIVDEVLAVGDLAFQRKCFDRMENMIKKQGKTVLLVSHSMRQIERITDRAILLHNGKVLADGESKLITEQFFELNNKKVRMNGTSTLSDGIIATLDKCYITNNNNAILEQVYHQQDFNICFDFHIKEKITNPIFSVGIHTTDLIYLSVNRSIEKISFESIAPGHHTIKCKINSFPFRAGSYSVRASIVTGLLKTDVFYGENLASFIVGQNEADSQSEYASEGFIDLDIDWTLE